MVTDAELCELACYAYVDWDILEEMLQDTNWKEFRYWEYGDTQAYFVRRSRLLESFCSTLDPRNWDSVLAFRGTESIGDVVTDCNIFGVLGPAGFGRVHRGFRNALLTIWPDVVSSLASSDKVEEGRLHITGHSLGGALADLAGAYILSNSFLRARLCEVVTFGAPRVGGLRYVGSYKWLEENNGRHVRYVNGADWVPRHPWTLWGYAHAGEQRELNGGWWRGRFKYPLTAGTRAHACNNYMTATSKRSEG